MTKQYLNVLIDSLQKKEKVLSELIIKNEEQAALLKQPVFDRNAFDLIVEEKSKLILEINKLDDGFELIFERIKQEITSETGRRLYTNEIQKLKELINSVTEKSIKIQAGEQRNKLAIEAYYSKDKGRMKGTTQTSQSAAKYYRNMKEKKYVSSYFLDSKK